MLVISEFVGCSPSLSGAIRVNPWNVDSVADGIYAAIKMPLADRHLRHVKHWRYVSAHTAAFWVKVHRNDDLFVGAASTMLSIVDRVRSNQYRPGFCLWVMLCGLEHAV